MLQLHPTKVWLELNVWQNSCHSSMTISPCTILRRYQIKCITFQCKWLKLTLCCGFLKFTAHTLIKWGRMTHIYVGKLTITTSSDSGLSPGRHQAIIWTYAGILLIGPLGTNFSETLIEIQTFSLKKICLKMHLQNVHCVIISSYICKCHIINQYNVNFLSSYTYLHTTCPYYIAFSENI